MLMETTHCISQQEAVSGEEVIMGCFARCCILALFVLLEAGGCYRNLGSVSWLQQLATAKERPHYCFQRKKDSLFQYMHNFTWTNLQSLAQR